MKAAVVRKAQPPPLRPRFSCYVISLLWNSYAQLRFGTGLFNEKVVSTPSLTQVKTLFPGCVEARISATAHLYGEVQKTSRPRLLLSFKEAKHATAARLVLQSSVLRATAGRVLSTRAEL